MVEDQIHKTSKIKTLQDQSDEGEESAAQDYEQQLQELQDEGQSQRVEEMSEDEYIFNYDYYDGATW